MINVWITIDFSGIFLVSRSRLMKVATPFVNQDPFLDGTEGEPYGPCPKPEPFPLLEL